MNERFFTLLFLKEENKRRKGNVPARDKPHLTNFIGRTVVTANLEPRTVLQLSFRALSIVSSPEITRRTKLQKTQTVALVSKLIKINQQTWWEEENTPVTDIHNTGFREKLK